MRAGRLSQRVTLQRLVDGSPQQLDTGEPDVAWTDVATVWADVRPLRGQRLFLAQQVNSRVTTEIEIRYSSDVSAVAAQWRVVLGSALYDIEAVINVDQANRTILLQCSTGVNEG